MDTALVEALKRQSLDLEMSLGLDTKLMDRQRVHVVGIWMELDAGLLTLRRRLMEELWEILRALHPEITPEMDRSRPELNAAHQDIYGKDLPSRDELLRPTRVANLAKTLEEAETPTRLYRIAHQFGWTHLVDLATELEADFLKRFGCGPGIWNQLRETLEYHRLQPEMSTDDPLIQTALAHLGRTS